MTKSVNTCCIAPYTLHEVDRGRLQLPRQLLDEVHECAEEEERREGGCTNGVPLRHRLRHVADGVEAVGDVAG